MCDACSRYRHCRAIILGSTGLIGRWVARALTQLGADLYLFHRDTADMQAVYSRYGILGKAITLDLSDLIMVNKTIISIQPDIIFNLAGYGVDRSERDEHQAYLINLDLVGNICSAMTASKRTDWRGQRIIHVGSALEYGEIHGDLNEDLEPLPTNSLRNV